MEMKGIVLAGGKGTRLYPLTRVVCKQLLPVYDKPMIYYPLSILMLAGIREVLIISTPNDLPAFERLLGDGSRWGMRFEFAEQAEPRGLADAFRIGRGFIGKETVCLILGDSIFYGQGLQAILRSAVRLEEGALIFVYAVKDASRYGVVELDAAGSVLSIEEKPKVPRSRLVATGIFFFDNRAAEIASGLKPSLRGELEISDLIRVYLERGMLRAEVLGRGIAWLDAGTQEDLLQAAKFIQTIQDRQGLMIASPEEIAFRMGYIHIDELRSLVLAMNHNPYSEYLQNLVDESLPSSGNR
jgi:glucose-1-phosphate thymidylyltransferase